MRRHTAVNQYQRCCGGELKWAEGGTSLGECLGRWAAQAPREVLGHVDRRLEERVVVHLGFGVKRKRVPPDVATLDRIFTMCAVMRVQVRAATAKE